MLTNLFREKQPSKKTETRAGGIFTVLFQARRDDFTYLLRKPLKNILTVILALSVLLLLFLGMQCHRDQSSRVEIARFQGDRKAAVSYSFDDGTMGHYLVVAPLLEKYGFRGTFAVVPGWTADDPTKAEGFAGSKAYTTKFPVGRLVSWSEWREVASRGHEISNHGLMHRQLPDLTDDQLVREVEEGRRIITEKVGRPITFIYPGRGGDDRSKKVVLRNHIAVREHEERFGGPSFNLAKADGIIDKAITNGQPIVIMTHAVEEAGYQPITRELLDSNLQYVSTLKDQIWVDTFANVSKYLQERDATKVTFKVCDTEKVIFSLSSPLDPVVFNEPLTCIVHARGVSKGSNVTCSQDGKPLPFHLSGEKVLVDVIPEGSEVTVQWTHNT